MPLSIAGFVRNGLVVPNSPLPEGAQVEIRLNDDAGESKGEPAAQRQAIHAVPPPGELRRMPREQRQAILAAAAEMAEEDCRTDQELTGFEAFSEEELDDEEPHSSEQSPGADVTKEKERRQKNHESHE